MQPINFPEANASMSAPPGFSAEQVATVRAFLGHIRAGTCKGNKLCITAWKPNAQELALLNKGQPIFVSFIGGMPPHFLTVTWGQAISPA